MNDTVTLSVYLRAHHLLLPGHSEFQRNVEPMFRCLNVRTEIGRKIFWAEKFGQRGELFVRGLRATSRIPLRFIFLP